jgi:predicted nucleic acid-binding protein
MADRTFVDTNVLVYSLDPSDGRKHAIARQALDPATSHDLVISTQVLSEFYVVTTRKLAVAPALAASMVQELSRLPIVGIDMPLVQAAIEGSRTWAISYWDALIIRAAEASNCADVLSEDLADGATYGSVVVRNPFAAT